MGGLIKHVESESGTRFDLNLALEEKDVSKECSTRDRKTDF